MNEKYTMRDVARNVDIRDKAAAAGKTKRARLAAGIIAIALDEITERFSSEKEGGSV